MLPESPLDRACQLPLQECLHPNMTAPAALERCDRFVARTMNWMYDHLRVLTRCSPLILTDHVENRSESAELKAWQWRPETLPRRVWHKPRGSEPWPPDLHRLRRGEPVLLHSHFGWVATGDHTLREAMELPWIVGIYGAEAYELPRNPAWRPQLEALGCDREKLVVHNLGVDLDALHFKARVRSPDEPLWILFAGTFREKKGVPDLIDALHLLEGNGVPVHLELVGDAAMKPGDAETKAEILARIRRWGLEDAVTRHPFLPFGELVELARHCHVLATPSVTAASGDAEGTVFITQQTMATGMPVVATRHADIPYTFGDLADSLVPERDPPALAAALRRYVEVPDALTTDGARVRRHAEENLDLRKAAEALARIYDRVTDGPGQG